MAYARMSLFHTGARSSRSRRDLPDRRGCIGGHSSVTAAPRCPARRRVSSSSSRAFYNGPPWNRQPVITKSSGGSSIMQDLRMAISLERKVVGRPTGSASLLTASVFIESTEGYR